jgi:serine/threonine protein kinase
VGEAVRLEATGTIVPARTFVFRGPAALLVGRAEDCDLRVPADDRRVSRHHCAFDIDPPAVRVRDLGSRNGTFVNGVRLAPTPTPAQTQTKTPAPAPASTPFASRPYELADGDEVRLGGVVVAVSTGAGHRRPDGHPRPAGDARIGDYTLVRELGRGAQGAVHLARHGPSGELRALKVLRPDAVLRPELVHGFLREINITRTLRHPRLVAFHEAGSTGTRFFLACEYCDGGSLARRVAERGGPLAPEEAVALILQVLDGLAYLHGRHATEAATDTAPEATDTATEAAMDTATEAVGDSATTEAVGDSATTGAVGDSATGALAAAAAEAVTEAVPSAAGSAAGPAPAGTDRLVNRDVKPQNILLTGPRTEPQVKIADFGLAKAFERAGLSGYTSTGALGGSVAFMPRSQIVNYKYAAPPVDVWAAAACLYWTLTGATPRDFPDGADPVGVVLREPVVPVLRRTRTLPVRLAGLIDSVLADGDAGGRTVPSALEFGRALREAM